METIEDTGIFGFDDEDEQFAYQQAMFEQWCNYQVGLALSVPEAMALFEGALVYRMTGKSHLDDI